MFSLTSQSLHIQQSKELTEHCNATSTIDKAASPSAIDSSYRNRCIPLAASVSLIHRWGLDQISATASSENISKKTHPEPCTYPAAPAPYSTQRRACESYQHLNSCNMAELNYLQLDRSKHDRAVPLNVRWSVKQKPEILALG